MKVSRSFLVLSALAGSLVLSSISRAEMGYGEASSMALALATSHEDSYSLGCHSASVVKVDEVYNSTNQKRLRAVLYADCIPCLHVYMFDPQSEKVVFSQAVKLADPVWYEKTCVQDRARYLGD
jgi:hypothetical protein